MSVIEGLGGEPKGPALDVVDLGMFGEAVGPAIRQLRNHLTVRIMEGLERFDLRTGSFSTLALIAANPGCAQSDISRETGFDKSVVVALIDELERRGFAGRARSHADRRRNILTLTDAGHTLLSEMNAVVREVEKPIRDALTQEELDMMLRLNRKALQAMLAHEAD